MKKLLSVIIISVLMLMNVCGALAEAPILPAPAEVSCSDGGVYVALVSMSKGFPSKRIAVAMSVGLAIPRAPSSV